MRWVFACAVALGLTLILSGGWAYHRLSKPLYLPASPTLLEVTPGNSVDQLAKRLTQDHTLPTPAWLMVAYARATGKARRIQAGEYRLVHPISTLGLLDLLVSGKVTTYQITIIEGWTFAQMREAIARHPKLQLTLAQVDDAHIMEKLGYPPQNPEGLFFPDTYQFTANTTDAALLKRAYRQMQNQLTTLWAQRSPTTPLKTPYEALTLASIIQKETPLDREKPEVSGVFSRRLEARMRLQADPTVIYGLGTRYTGDITRADLRADTPYNTYTRYGLPPTPICLPGQRAIEAAVQPAPGNSLYFVADGAGGHRFADTLQEHNANVRLYLDYLRQSKSPPP